MFRTFKHIITIALLLFSFEAIAQGTTRYHKIEYTASSVKLVEWNIKDTLNTAFAKETSDALGRTKELRFYNCNHQLQWADSGFYGGSIIKYDYEEGKITETFFSSDSEIANDFKTSEVPYRYIYFLNDKNEITDIKEVYKMDFEWDKGSLEETIKHLEFYKSHIQQMTDFNSVFGYSYAYAKLNTINPQRAK